MSIKIGHASVDERGRYTGGAAGDQTGKEVCVRVWYSKPWALVLRAVDANAAEQMAAACEAACGNSNIGYDQGQRNTLNAQAAKVGYDLAKITVECECDCSSLMTVCAQAAGIAIPYTNGNAPTTSTMRAAFGGTGAFEVLTQSKYLTSDAYLKRGDILVAPGAHTAMALENGGSAANTANTTKEEYCTVNVRVLTRGKTGEDVRAMQRLLIGAGYGCGSSGADASFGPATDTALRAYQKAKGLTVDGSCGPATWSKLLGAAE